MGKGILKRMTSMLLALVLVLGLLPAVALPAYAAPVSGLSDPSIGLDSNGGTWNAKGTGVNGSVSGKDKEGCSSASPGQGSLKISNNKGTEAALSFDYALTLDGGSVEINGGKVTENGHYSTSLAAGGSVTISITSQAGAAHTTSIALTNLYLVRDGSVTVTFLPAQGGSYTVDGEAVGQDGLSKTNKTSHAYTLAATPAEGYQFLGWKNGDGAVISTEASAKMYFDADTAVTPWFIPVGTAAFTVDGAYYTDLNLAVEKAQDGGKLVVVAQDGILPAGEYTIPNGVTLLVPCDSANTIYQTEPETTGKGYTKPSCYRNLILSNGTSISVESGGAISVGSKHTGLQNPGPGSNTGPYGQIQMEEGSSITLNSGGKLYAYGFITGSGSVTAQSGSEVREYFQIHGWRGGRASLSMKGRQERVFPFSQYYVQNVEVPLTIFAGASEILYTTVYSSVSTESVEVPFVGNGGLFQLGEGGSFTKRYLPEKDRMEIEVSGNLTLNEINIQGFGSSAYVLPLHGGLSVTIHNGTASFNSDISLLPGAELTVDEGARLNLSSNLFLYDSEEWVDKKYVFSNADLRPVNYSPTRSYTRTAADLTDVTLDLNGTLIVTAGGIYTTAGGANITSSSGTGTLILQSAPSEAQKLYEVTQSGSDVTYWDISITPAILQNSDGTVTATAGAAPGTMLTYLQAEGKWIKQEAFPGVTLEPVSIPYDGTPHTVTTQPVPGNPLQIQYSPAGENAWTGDAPTDSGTYDVKITRPADAYYTEYEQTFENIVAITPRTVEVTWTADSFIYDGTVHQVTPQITNLIPGDTVQTTLSNASATNAGSYTAEITGLTGADSGNYTLDGGSGLSQKWSIGKAAKPEVTFPTAEDATYNPKQVLSSVPLIGGSTTLGTFAWANPDMIPTPAVSEYDVIFTPSDLSRQNYEGMEDPVQQSVSLTVNKAKQDVPTGIMAEQPSVIDGSGKLTGLTVAMEWSADQQSWSPVTADEAANGMVVEPPKTLYIRLAETEYYLAGTAAEFTFEPYDPNQEPTPAARIDYQEEMLIGLEAGREYRVNGTPVSADEQGRIDLEEDWLGTTVQLIAAGNGTTTIDSQPQSIPVPARPIAPTLTTLKATEDSAADGAINGLLAENRYEYRVSGADSWTTVEAGSTSIHGLRPGSYEVRQAATEAAFCGIAATVVIDVRKPVSIALTMLPVRSFYLEGQPLDPTGGQVTITYDDNTTRVLELSTEMLSGYDPAKLGQQEVTITVGGCTATWIVTVEKKSLDSISITKQPEKTSYVSGETFSAKGMEVTAHYNNGTNAVVTDYTIAPDGPLSTNTTQVTVSYTEGEITKTAAVRIEVTTSGGGGGGGGGTTVSKYSITVTKSDNGSVAADQKTAEAGETVILTVTPDEGYKLDTLTITAKDGSKVKLTDKGDGKYTFTMPAAAVTVKAAFVKDDAPVVPELPFADVKAGEWFYNAVKYVYDNKLMDGISATTFAPFMTTNRGMVVTILWRLEGQPKAENTLPFSDVESGMWYTDAVNWAASQGIVKGYSDTVFASDDTVTREQLATILYRYAQGKGYDVSAAGDLTAFSDSADVSAWAAEAMEWAVGSKLLSGKGGNILDPTGTATRAEVAQILMNFCQVLETGLG
ncbi:MAG: S-layer homology domain-containing protein [Clostridiales bacterium]|nr:S-layer homology domain-containing protein [Clostridiales bacterium]